MIIQWIFRRKPSDRSPGRLTPIAAILGIALIAGESLGQRPSPLAGLDPAKIPAAERTAGMPAEVVAVLGSQQGRHPREGDETVGFSPDGRRLACGGEDGILHILDTATCSEVGRVSVRGYGANSLGLLAYSPDSRRLATSSHDLFVRLWDVTGDQPKEVGSTPNGRGGSDGTRLCTRRQEHRHRNLFANRKSGKVYDLGSGMPKLRWHHAPQKIDGYVTSLAFTPDGKRMASAKAGGLVQLWDLSKDQPEELFSFSPLAERLGIEFAALAFSPDGKTLAYRGASLLSLWDIVGDRPIELDVVKSEARLNAIYTVSFSRDGRRLATAGAAGGVARVYELEGNRLKEFAVLEGHDEHLRDLSFARDGRTLATAGPVRGITLWDLDRKPQVPRLLWSSFLVAPDQATVSGGGIAVTRFAAEKSYEVWDLRGAEPRLIRKVESNSDCIAISARNVIAAAEGDAIVIWALREGRLERRGVLKRHSGPVNSLSFSSDGKLLISSAKGDLFACLWDPEDPVARSIGRLEAFACVRVTASIIPLSLAIISEFGHQARWKRDQSFQVWKAGSCSNSRGSGYILPKPNTVFT